MTDAFDPVELLDTIERDLVKIRTELAAIESDFPPSTLRRFFDILKRQVRHPDAGQQRDRASCGLQQTILIGHTARQGPEHAVILEQVRACIRLGEVIDRNNLDIGMVRRRQDLPQDDPPDPSEPVDTDPCHRPRMTHPIAHRTTVHRQFIPGLRPSPRRGVRPTGRTPPPPTLRVEDRSRAN